MIDLEHLMEQIRRSITAEQIDGGLSIGTTINHSAELEFGSPRFTAPADTASWFLKEQMRRDFICNLPFARKR